jgi:hypothetical protein
MPGAQSGGEGNFWWSVNYGNVHFTSMSTEHDYNPGSPQYIWLEQVIILDIVLLTNRTFKKLTKIEMNNRGSYS